MTLLFDIETDDMGAELVVQNDDIEFRQRASDRQLKRLMIDLAHYLEDAEAEEPPTDRLDKRHHNAPKDGNDGPEGI